MGLAWTGAAVSCWPQAGALDAERALACSKWWGCDVTEESQYPLVTFALFAYNQEKYIREAVEAALLQDYPNLEIIISDDASMDSTWNVIDECVTNYRGPHRLVLNRNRQNLGLGRHVNRIFELASGELIVVAAGDDMSLADRVTKTVRAWQAAGCPDGVVHGQAVVIDSEGRPTGAIIEKNRRPQRMREFALAGFHSIIHGATAAYTPAVMRFFGPLQCDIEDRPLTFRALMLGNLVYVDSRLIRYRTGVGNISALMRRSDRGRAGKWCLMQRARIEQHRIDYLTYCERFKHAPSRRILLVLHRLKWRYSIAEWTASENVIKNLLGLCFIPLDGGLRDRLYVVAAYFGLR